VRNCPKSDVDPAPETIEHYRAQVRTYLDVIEAERGWSSCRHPALSSRLHGRQLDGRGAPDGPALLAPAPDPLNEEMDSIARANLPITILSSMKALIQIIGAGSKKRTIGGIAAIGFSLGLGGAHRRFSDAKGRHHEH
jgi:hypothetical protein